MPPPSAAAKPAGLSAASVFRPRAAFGPLLIATLVEVSTASSREKCPWHCSGHGTCIESGYCVCRRGYAGVDCSRVEAACSHNCAGRGRCDGQRCICDAGFGGHDCGRALARTCPSSCSGHGICDPATGHCACGPGFAGDACEAVISSPGCRANCSARGLCAGGSCVCERGFLGEACEWALTAALGAPADHRPTSSTRQIACPAACSGHGKCLLAAGVCACDSGWYGVACDGFNASRQRCAHGCSGHGVCVRNRCLCDDGFGGDNCAELLPHARCPLGCSAHGECRATPQRAGALGGTRLSHMLPYRVLSLADGVWRHSPQPTQGVQCECHDGSGGVTCARGVSVAPSCPHACSGHGICRDGLGCVCEAGYGGDDCGIVCPFGCSGHGRCTEEGACVCEAGYAGARCELRSACPGACSGRGECAPALDANLTAIVAEAAARTAAAAQATAARATTNVDLARAEAESAHAASVVSAEAARAAALPRCHCARGWRAEPDCSVRDAECPIGCSGHGVCVGGECNCETGWHGPFCATSTSRARRAALRGLGLEAV